MFAIKPCLIDLIIGIPPPTAASNNKLTSYFSDKTDKASPCFAINALFAVTTCFLFFNASKTILLAIPSAPPTSSTIISIFGSFVISKGFFCRTLFEKEIPLFLFIFLADTLTTFNLKPVFFWISDEFF